MSPLAKKQLGRTGLEVTVLGYGAMELRGTPRGRDVTEEQSQTILNAVLDAGINYIDTSVDYGLSEQRIGKYISNRRTEYYIASKCGCVVGVAPAPAGTHNPHIFTPENIVAGVEQSLKRMKTDYIPSSCIKIRGFEAEARCLRAAGEKSGDILDLTASEIQEHRSN